MKKFNALMTELVESKMPKPRFDRQSFIRGDLVKLGDIVEAKGIVSDVIWVGTNYVTILNEGKPMNVWASDIKVLQKSSDDIPQPICEGSSVEFRGYTTRNFTPEMVQECSSATIAREDILPFFSMLMNVDSLMEADGDDIHNAYHKYKMLYERSMKCVDKFGINFDILNSYEDLLLAESIVSGLNFTTTNKQKIAAIIGQSFEVPLSESPEETVNEAIAEIKKHKYTTEGWKFVGVLLNHATRAGIKWDNTFHPVTQKHMGLK